MTDPRPPAASGENSTRATLMWVIAFAIGWGMVTEHPTGVLMGAILGYLFSQVFALRSHVGRLSERLQQLEGRPAAPARGAQTSAVTPAADTGSTTREPATPPTPVRPSWEPQITTLPPVTPRPSWKETPTAAPSAMNQFVDRSIASIMGWVKGGNPLARVGVVLLFFGGAFLAKYASEAGLFPIEFRLMALAAGAMALLGVGWWLRERERVYALTLQGGGIAILYLTVFVALKMYHLVEPGFALPLLIVVALSAAVLAVAQNALSMAVIGFSGGFLAPILASTGSGNHIALFSYYAVLNLGLFAIAWFRAWRVLNLIGFIFTFGIAGTFRALAYKPEDLMSTDFFVILFFLMYVAISILFAIRQPPKLKGYVSSSLVFGLPIAAFTIQATLVHHIEYGLSFSALALGLFYLVLAWVIFLSRHANLRLLAEAFAALGVIFASIAIPTAFDKQVTAAMWAVEGAGLLWLGTRQNRKLARAFGAALQLLGGGGFLLGLHDLHVDRALLNSGYAGSVMLAVAGLLSGLWLYRTREQRASYEEGTDIVLGLWGVAWWVYGGLAEIHRFVDTDYHLGAVLGFAAATLLILHLLGARLSWPLPGRIAMGLLPLAVVLGFLAAGEHDHPFAQFGHVGWLALFGVGYGLLYRQEIAADDWLDAPSGWLHPFMLWSVGLFAAWESAWQVEQQVGGVWADLPWGLVAALLLWTLSRSMPFPAWPLARHVDLYRLRAAPVLAVFAALWIVGINLSSDGNPGWVRFIPLLNPLDISVALLFGALASWWMSLSAEAREFLPLKDPRIVQGAFAALAFLWLSASLVRALHYTMDTPLDQYGVMHSFLVQAGLSIFWGLLGFGTMLLATRLGKREMWIAGAGLMAVVVVKLFLVDLEGSGTLARIASFITIGALLLVTGYFSPLPPRSSTSESTDSSTTRN